MKSPSSTVTRRIRAAITIAISLAVGTVGGTLAVVQVRPSVGAHGADLLRNVIGDEAVANLETVMLYATDAMQQAAYQLGIGHAQLATTRPAHDLRAADLTPTAAEGTPRRAQAGRGGASASLPEPQLADWSWWPPSRPSLGNLPQEGQWTAYINNATGDVAAYRMFLQPDPDRPYAVTAIVAFNLKISTLHFVMGFEEPQSSVKFKRTGKIPAGDAKPGVLLAAFNGGFKARHGHFGAMADGVVALPPRDGLGTVAIYNDGAVHIGAWGTQITADKDLAAWRQNGPLIIDQGRIDPRTADASANEWGGNTVKNTTPSWRSALGISADGNVLYYAAGPSLTLDKLARALADAGADEAIQLDINNYWVSFEAISATGSTLIPVPLFDQMRENADRYLRGYARDFFYLTAKPSTTHS